MMKKLLLMLLLVVGGVFQVNATKRLWVNLTESNSYWTEASSVTCIHYGSMNWNTHTPMIVYNMYGSKWCYYDVPDDITTVVLKRCGYENNVLKYWNWQSVDITMSSGDMYIKLTSGNNIGIEELSAPSWSIVVIRGNFITPGTTWTNIANNMVKDGDKFTYTISKSDIDAITSDTNLNNGKILFRFHHGDKVKIDDYGTDKGDDQYPEIAPQGNNPTISMATDVTDYYQDVDAAYCWEIAKPTYEYDHLVFTADYSTHRWVIRVDAYFSKTVSGTNHYATFGTTVPVDLTGLSGVTAYTVTANASTGKLTLTQKSDALAANEGVLLENTTNNDVTVSIPVAASATASSNNLVAFTGGNSNLQRETETGYTNYILTKVGEKVGFFRVHENGNAMGANTAYLHVANAAGARESFFFEDDETTNIDAVKAVNVDGQAYNLNGQRVAQPAKGLYIVNGKKVIMK